MSKSRPLIVKGFGIDHADLPPFEAGRNDPRDWFDNPAARLEIEIGCGKGTFLVQQAAVLPNVNYLGFEWAGEFYRYAADRMRRHQLSNVKIVHTDATEFLRFRCVDEVAAVIHLYFSDPWPKKRHHKRRVIQDASLAEFHRVLISGGEARLVTDHDDLWTWYQQHASRHVDLFEVRDVERIESATEGEIVGSNFERKYRREGRAFHAMTLVKK
ncbi:MAG: tRNA (guanosine(46)-N7)-methyltransferase TrmB [Phycisphaerales bacterium]|nr:tRNA (guanosine(46)-N7)-methyltransferase TrmB [Phycisphaerales bacterium]MCI0677104.1 tRNA (guanosine(46)-N7)-methyltransferase TrmB [Phycisphaerales bacterium]